MSNRRFLSNRDLAIIGITATITGILVSLFQAGGPGRDSIDVEVPSGTANINTGSGTQNNIELDPSIDYEQMWSETDIAIQDYTTRDRQLMAGFRAEAHEYTVGCEPGHVQLDATECAEYRRNMTRLYVQRVELFNANKALMEPVDARSRCLYIRGFWTDFEQRFGLERPARLNC